MDVCRWVEAVKDHFLCKKFHDMWSSNYFNFILDSICFNTRVDVMLTCRVDMKV